jgi:glutamine amidotransferase
MTIGIVDYGMGNLLSVYSAFDYLGAQVKICTTPDDLNAVDKIVIPGVGAFKDCISRIDMNGFHEALDEHTRQKGKPTMGICLGMQVMAQKSFEGGEFHGLGWFDAEVIRLHPKNRDLHIPNIGWNEVLLNTSIPLFKGMPQKADLYLVHSFYMSCQSKTDIVAEYYYNHAVTAAVLKDNVFATQFHPEKSQDLGLRIIDNFITWNP